MRSPASVPLSIRPAIEADRALLFEWANDPVTRAQSFSSGAITWEAHCAWFAGVIADPDRRLYLLLAPRDEPVGQARFDPSGARDAVISLALAPAWRGRGLAATAIRLATERARREAGFVVIHAYIRPGNAASRKAFARAGYTERGPAQVRGQEAVHLTRDESGGTPN